MYVLKVQPKCAEQVVILMKSIQESTKVCLTRKPFKTAVSLLLTLACFYQPQAVAAKKDTKKTEPPATLEERFKEPSMSELEQQEFNLISTSIKGDDLSYWPEETTPQGATSKVLLVESPYLAYKEHGNALIMAAPGIYPYQARWYNELTNELNNLGWNALSLGLQPNPKTRSVPNRESYSKMTPEELKTFNAEAKQMKETAIETWLNSSKMRTQLLVSFSNNREAPLDILIAEGLSAHVAGLAAAEPNTQLTGLVLINLQSPSDTAQQELEQSLTTQGPILDITFNPNRKTRAEAVGRKQGAIKAGNTDYRIAFAPPGMHFDNTAAPWLATLIHGWAVANDPQKNQ